MRFPARTASLGAVAMAAWMAFEGFSPKPYVPVKGDRPTIGHGSTYYSDGTPVTLQDPPITRKQAYDLAYGELSNTYFACVKDSLGNTLVNQTEIDIATDFAGQYGCGAWRTSPMLKHLQAQQYSQACKAYAQYRFMTSPTRVEGWEPYTKNGKTRWRFDCSTPGNKVCRGVWLRQEQRIKKCEAAL